MHVGAGKDHENVVPAEAKSLDVLGPWKIKPWRDFHGQAKGKGHSNDLFTSNCVPDINLYPGSTQQTEVGASLWKRGTQGKAKNTTWRHSYLWVPQKGGRWALLPKRSEWHWPWSHMPQELGRAARTQCCPEPSSVAITRSRT